MDEPQLLIEPDPVIEAYKKDVDRTLLRENLKLTVEERLRNLMRHQRFCRGDETGRAAGLPCLTSNEQFLPALSRAGVGPIIVGGI